MKSKKISPKEKLFCIYYIESRNGREAAARAGYTICPDKAAIKLLMRDEVKKEIAKGSKLRPVSLDEVCAGYRRLAFGSAADALRLLFTEEPLSDESLEKMDMFNISEIKRPKGGGIEIKFFDRLKPLEKLQVLSEYENNSDSAADFYQALDRGAKALDNKN